MASWRPPGSILEAPGLDFGGFWKRFFEIFDRFWVRFFEVVALQTKCQECQESQERRERPDCKILPLNALSQVWVGGGVPPRGSSIRRPTVGGAKRVGPEVNSSKVQLQMPNLITLSPGCLYTPL